MRVGQFFLAIDVARFMAPEEFTARMLKFREMIKNTQPALGYDEVLLAGEPEWRAQEQRAAGGIPIPRPTWEVLSQLGSRLGVSVPEAATIE